ncbi:MAG TPA: sarcosine oxidase, partial [Dehalococcoidia bacterium]|nr:sarcosine oxidase [Dehalococcoidia bacterium]
CLYSDTWDGDFWIDRDPEREGLMVATGGSGHAFKFTPVLGGLVADALEGIENPYSKRFAWRALGEVKHEEIRYTGE